MFNVFMNHLQNETECIFRKLVDDIGFEVVLEILECKVAIQGTGF